LTVISEPLGFQQRDNEITEHSHARQQADRILEPHVTTSLHQPIASGYVADAERKEENRESYEPDVAHVNHLSGHLQLHATRKYRKKVMKRS
jgi:hypothetical protein